MGSRWHGQTVAPLTSSVAAILEVPGANRTLGGGWSDWSADTPRTWQTPAAPNCSPATTWYSVTVSVITSDVVGAPGYINPLSGTKAYQVLLSGGYTGGTRTWGDWTHTWFDSDPEIRPDTTHNTQAALANDGGWSDWGPSCQARTASPPVPATPGIWSSKSTNDITWGWSRPVNAGYFELRDSDLSFVRYNGGSTGYTYWNAPYNTNQCGRIRASYNSRLASWGYWSAFSGPSCQKPVLPPPATPSAGFDFRTQHYCSPTTGFDLKASWSAVPYATGYDARMQYRRQTDGKFSAWSTISTSGTSTGWSTITNDYIYGAVGIQIRSKNASGVSRWSAVSGVIGTGGCQQN